MADQTKQKVTMIDKMQTGAGRVIRAGAAITAAVSLLAFSVSPALASVPPAHIQDGATGQCLDSNISFTFPSFRGAVYTNPCWPKDNYQKWHATPSGEIIDNQTGLCLTYQATTINLGSLRIVSMNPTVITTPCTGDITQMWYHWRESGHTGLSASETAAPQSPFCLDDSPLRAIFDHSAIYMNTCNFGRYQNWLGVPITSVIG
jgi:hypothetical protein